MVRVKEWPFDTIARVITVSLDFLNLFYYCSLYQALLAHQVSRHVIVIKGVSHVILCPKMDSNFENFDFQPSTDKHRAYFLLWLAEAISVTKRQKKVWQSVAIKKYVIPKLSYFDEIDEFSKKVN